MLFETLFYDDVPLGIVGAHVLVTTIALGLRWFGWQAPRRRRIRQDTTLERLRRDGTC